MDAAWAQFRPTRCSATTAMLSSPHPSLLSGHGPKFPHSLYYSVLSFRVGDTRYTPTAHEQGFAIRAICSGPTLYCVMREFCPRRYEGTPTSQDDTDTCFPHSPQKGPTHPFRLSRRRTNAFSIRRPSQHEPQKPREGSMNFLIR